MEKVEPTPVALAGGLVPGFRWNFGQFGGLFGNVAVEFGRLCCLWRIVRGSSLGLAGQGFKQQWSATRCWCFCSEVFCVGGCQNSIDLGHACIGAQSRSGCKLAFGFVRPGCYPEGEPCCACQAQLVYQKEFFVLIKELKNVC